METRQNNTNSFYPLIIRPQLLAVICILTWICSGLIFISTTYSALFPPTPEETYDSIDRVRALYPDAADKMEAAIESQTPFSKGMSTGLTLIGLCLTLFGTIQMWQLKRGGFKYYVAGEIIPYLGFLFTGIENLGAFGAMSGLSAVTIATVTIGFMLMFDAIFIWLYALNLKHM